MEKSKLVLGTAQLGMKYGLNNSHGQPTKEESFAILDAALAGGINTFDTAYAYGDSEEVIGQWIESRKLAGRVNIISKLKPHVLNEYPDGTKAVDIIRVELEKSLKRLGLERFDGYLLHSPHYIYLQHVVAALGQAKQEGLASYIGVSTYDEAEALQAAELAVDYIQVPYNVFDQRLDRTDFFEIAQKNKVTVFARAPFLQGLLLMSPANLPERVAHARQPLEAFIQLADHYGLSRAQLCLLFAYTHPQADHIVFGVDSLSQLQENLAIVSSPPTTIAPIVAELKEQFQNMSRAIVMPSLWSKIRS